MCQGVNLMGRNFLREIVLDWQKIQAEIRVHKISAGENIAVSELLKDYEHLFKDDLGKLKGNEATIHLQEGATPIFPKSRPVPYTLRKGIEAELECLEAQGTIKPVNHSDWATPIVPIEKTDSTVRICGDYKLTINKASKKDNYPIPKVDDIYAKLAGGQKLTELDLSHAYEQIMLDEASREYVTINTHRGLYQYLRLPYGMSSAPGIFQRIMDCVFQGMPNVVAHLDNSIITGPSDEAHLANLTRVLEKLSQLGLRLKGESANS